MSWTTKRYIAEKFADYWVEHGQADRLGHVYKAVVAPRHVLAAIRGRLENFNFNGTEIELPVQTEWEFIVDARSLSITLVETASARIARAEREEARLRARMDAAR
jgi:hypothetical protein